MKPIVMLAILLLSACASVKSDVRTTDSDAAKNLTTYASSLLGVPYKYGGNSPDSGFDCSGFVGHVFRHTMGIKLPRSSDDISHMGQAIGKSNLRTGDLVFFNTLQRKFSHVGIYLGDGLFAHASLSSGVVVSILGSDYYKRHYVGARRVFR